MIIKQDNIDLEIERERGHGIHNKAVHIEKNI